LEDGNIRSALIYSAFPVAVILAGWALAAFRLMTASLTSAVQLFASGSVFAVIAIELLPDVILAHSTEGFTGFGLGVVAMIVTNWLSRSWERASDKNDRRLPSLLNGAGARISIAGVLIGGGFVAGVREGQLLTLVATVEALAVTLTLISALGGAGMRRCKLLLVAATLAAMIIAGATAGDKFMWERSGADLDLIFAICLAVPLLRAMESLMESYEDHSSPWSLAIFFADVVVFLLLGRSLGGEHPAHPGVRVKDQRSSFVTSKPAQKALELGTPLTMLKVTQRNLYRVHVGEGCATEPAVGRGELQFIVGAGKKNRAPEGELFRLTVQQPL
jgi:ZIP family zinc transporter